MSKVLKSKLIEFVEVCEQHISARIEFYQNRGSLRKSRELKKLSNKTWEKEYELSKELSAQSGISDDLLRALAYNGWLSVRPFTQICSVLEVLGVEITDEK